MKLLQGWLFLVGFFRLSSVYFGFFNKWALELAVFSRSQMTDIHGRTFGAWTSMTCLLCVMAALHFDNNALFLTTALSFILVFLSFLLEFAVYQTMSVKNFALIGTIASVSAVWMFYDILTKRLDASGNWRVAAEKGRSEAATQPSSSSTIKEE
eukprot:TRINITY_DN9540_c0_g1_i1.p1 TRINITY_DN9540_c0_g1~~TRINITY_DN9540_c0_g1_i1.p1  ORF type:complete len:154 (+),score=30.02 TRINITY_DN9540_c0_g1_i1:166-627(+)